MTCSECSNEVPEGASTCPFCGAPVETVSTSDLPSCSEASNAVSTPTPERSALASKGNDTPRLWDPVVLCILTLPVLGSLIASILVALNWQELKQRNKAIVAWSFWPCWFVIVIFLKSSAAEWVVAIISFCVWFVVLGLPQIQYFKKHVPSDYAKRRWVIPVAVGLGLNALPFFLN